MPDMYKDGAEGLYWFTGGWNLRAIAALFGAMAPCIPGFIWTCIDPDVDNAAVQMYQITYFIAAPLAAVLYLSFNMIWPVEVGSKEFLPNTVLDGVSSDEDRVADDEVAKIPPSEVKEAQD